jgi:hypothetical protein
MTAPRSTVRIAGWRWRDGSNRETLANQSKPGHLRGFPNQTVGVSCGQVCSAVIWQGGAGQLVRIRCSAIRQTGRYRGF